MPGIRKRELNKQEQDPEQEQVEDPYDKIHGEASWLNRWSHFWCVIPKTMTDHLVSVDLTNLWRKHLVWAKKSGDDLKGVVTARYASTTVFLSLLVSSEIGVLFSPSKPADQFRFALRDEKYWTVEFWAGITLGIAIISSVCALLSNFTAWSIFSSLSKENTAIVLRSSLGLYSAQLPNRLVTLAIYLFFSWLTLFWFVIFPSKAAYVLTFLGICLLSHMVTTYSAIARIIMYTSAMSHEPILEASEEERLTPQQLSDALIENALNAKLVNIPVNRQYKIQYQQAIRAGTRYSPLAHSSGVGGNVAVPHHNNRQFDLRSPTGGPHLKIISEKNLADTEDADIETGSDHHS